MRFKRRTPSGRIAFHHRKERPAPAKCANCKMPLHGVQRKMPSQFKKLSASERRPERPYGGYFCSGCSREVFKERTRSI